MRKSRSWYPVHRTKTNVSALALVPKTKLSVLAPVPSDEDEIVDSWFGSDKLATNTQCENTSLVFSAPDKEKMSVLTLISKTETLVLA